MGLSYQYDPGDKIVRAKVVGEYDLAEYADIMRELTSGDKFAVATATIWDLRGFDFSSFDIAMVNLLAKARSSYPERKGTIISYVVADPVGYEWLKMFIIMTDTEDTSDVFFDYLF